LGFGDDDPDTSDRLPGIFAGVMRCAVGAGQPAAHDGIWRLRPFTLTYRPVEADFAALLAIGNRLF
jgi:hypothetical protein